jgi:hypothetical protein
VYGNAADVQTLSVKHLDLHELAHLQTLDVASWSVQRVFSLLENLTLSSLLQAPAVFLYMCRDDKLPDARKLAAADHALAVLPWLTNAAIIFSPLENYDQPRVEKLIDVPRTFVPKMPLLVDRLTQRGGRLSILKCP